MPKSLLPFAPDEHQLEWRFDDHGAQLLRTSVRALLFVVVPLLVVLLMWRPEDYFSGYRWQIAPAVLLVALFTWRLLRRGRHADAIRVLLWGLWIAITVQCFVVSGIRTPAAMVYPLLLMQTGWLLGRRNTYAMFVATLLLLIGMALADAWLWPNQAPRHAVNHLAALTAFSVLACALTGHIVRNYSRQYEKAVAARDELSQQLGALRASEDKFEKLFRLVPVPLSVAELETGRTLHANDAWLQIFGYTRAEAIGRTSVELGIWVDPAARAAWVAGIRGDGRLVGHHVRFRSRDGTVHDMLAYVERVTYDDRDCIFTAHIDLTDRLRNEEAIRRLNADLERRVEERTASLTEAIGALRRAQDELLQSEKLASLGSMVAGMAHELNTPIGNALTVATTLYENAMQLEQQFRDNALKRSALEQFVADARTATVLIERSLGRANTVIQSFKQVAIDQTSEWRREFSLPRLVDDVTSTLRPSHRHRSHLIIVNIDEDIVMDSYPGPLGQVIANLVENAMLHGLDAREHGEIRIDVEQPGLDQVELRVSDNGQGIAPENIGRIFDPFFTTRLGKGGSGLGLSIVYRLVTTLLGGSIRVESQPGQGTAFVVQLPRIAPAPQPEP